MGTCAQTCFVTKSEQLLITVESLAQREIEVDPESLDVRLAHSPTPTFMDCEATSHSELQPQPAPLNEENVGTEEERYEGELDEQGRRHGYGVCVWADGKQYEGEWVCGVINGHGRMEWPDGRCYEGQFTAGLKQGKGVFRWRDGRRYDGEWLGDLQHGNGVFTCSDGEQIAGIWSVGKRK